LPSGKTHHVWSAGPFRFDVELRDDVTESDRLPIIKAEVIYAIQGRA
jgi:hypothetical protein